MSTICQWQPCQCSFHSSTRSNGQCKRISWTPLRSNFTAGTPVVRQGLKSYHRSCRQVGTPVAAATDMQIRVKLSVAASTDKLDLSNFGLHEVPAGVCNLNDLKELSLAGNELTYLPDCIGKLTNLQKLQLSGNYLQALPDSLCNLTALQGFWAHGNLITYLPEQIGALNNLHTISLTGNRVASLPTSISALVNLKDLALQGNQLTEAIPEIGALRALTKLTMHGNRLEAVAPEVGQLTNLQELCLQGNLLTQLPNQLCQLSALQSFSVADNLLQALPDGMSSLLSLKQLWAYGNQLHHLPPELLNMPAITHMWLEGNPLQAQSLNPLLTHLAAQPHTNLKEMGLDADQVQGIKPASIAAAEQMSVGRTCGTGPGYFKLQLGQSKHPGAREEPKQGKRLLVVSFGSAPGLPNWGGLLKKVSKGMPEKALPFDTLYVVDPARDWYHSGDDQFSHYWDQLQQVTAQYDKVVMLGDSMGASASLLFSPLATSVHAFSPQVDLTTSSIRPAWEVDKMKVMKDRMISNVSESSADITVHVSSWEHDTEQGAMLPKEKVKTRIYSFSDHRLAFYLDSINQLELIIQDSILVQQGVMKPVAAVST